MKVRIPYVFKEVYIHPKKKSDSVFREHLKSIKVDIPEIEGASAPVVATWTFGLSDSLCVYHETKEVPVRHRDGVFYVRASSHGTKSVGVEALVPCGEDRVAKSDRISFAKFIGRDDNAFVEMLITAMGTGEMEAFRDYGTNFARLVLRSSAEKAEKKRVLRLASALVVIDGEVWMRTYEPALVARKLYEGGRWKGETSVTLNFSRNRYSGLNLRDAEDVEIFNISDEVGVERLIASGKMRRSKDRDVSEVKVIDPSVFRFDRESAVLGRVLFHVYVRYLQMPASAPQETRDIHSTLVGEFRRFEDGLPFENGLDDIAELVGGFLRRMPGGEYADAISRNLMKFEGIADDMRVRPERYRPDDRMREGLDILVQAKRAYEGRVGSMGAAAVAAFLELRQVADGLDGFSRLEDVLAALEEILGHFLSVVASDKVSDKFADLLAKFDMSARDDARESPIGPAGP